MAFQVYKNLLNSEYSRIPANGYSGCFKYQLSLHNDPGKASGIKQLALFYGDWAFGLNRED